MSFFKNEFNKKVKKCLFRYAETYGRHPEHMQLLFFLKNTEAGLADGYKICINYKPVRDKDDTRDEEITIRNVLDVGKIDFTNFSAMMPPVIVKILVATAEKFSIPVFAMSVIAVMHKNTVRLCVYRDKSTYVDDLSEDDIVEMIE